MGCLPRLLVLVPLLQPTFAGPVQSQTPGGSIPIPPTPRPAGRPTGPSGLVLGPEVIVPGELAVVHSGGALLGALFNTSNIYLIRGVNDQVWIFGMGYGDPSPAPAEPSDFRFYRGVEYDSLRTALVDAVEADLLITGEFGLSRASARLRFLVPHQHLDHVNEELLASMFTLGYSRATARVFVHTNDFTGSTCNQPCCGILPCADEQNPFTGVPFHRSWTPDNLALFQAIGQATDGCNDPLLSFDSPNLGTWTVRKARQRAAGGHTDGSINLDNDSFGLRIRGAAASNPCPAGPGWRILPIHGNLE